MGVMDDAERLRPGTVEEWSDWLREHHSRRQGVWLVARLEQAGLMEPAGAAAVAVAKETGTWTVMDLLVPDALSEAFAHHPGAEQHWESWSPSTRKAILGWIVLAKRSETGATRVATTAEQAARGEKPVS